MAHNPHLKHRHIKRNGHAFDYVMDIAALASPIALLPQVYQIFETHTVSGLSLTTWLLLCGLNVLWVAYGAYRQVTPIVIVNVLCGILNFAGIVGIVLYS